MRTTLNIDDDVLAAVKSLATAHHTSAGKVISELARKAMLSSENQTETRTRTSVPFFTFPRKGNGKLVTMEIVNRLRDEDE